MGIYKKLASLAFFSALGGAVFMASRKLIEIKQHNFNLPQGFTYTAHTGCDGTPDNSLDSIKKTIALGAPVSENDVTLRKDGTPVLMHSDLAENNEGLPLCEALSYIKENSDTLLLNLDLKNFTNLEKIQKVVSDNGLLERSFFTGVEEQNTQTVKIDAPHIPYYLNVDLDKSKLLQESYIMSVVYKTKQSSAIGINCDYHNASPKLVEIFHREGLKVSFWTADNKMAIEYLLSLSPDNITTRNPVLLKNLLNNNR